MSAVRALFPGIAQAAFQAAPAPAPEPMPCGMDCSSCPMAEAICHAPEPIDVDPEEAAAYFAGEIPEAAAHVAQLHGLQATPEPPYGSRCLACAGTGDRWDRLTNDWAPYPQKCEACGGSGEYTEEPHKVLDLLSALEASVAKAKAARLTRQRDDGDAALARERAAIQLEEAERTSRRLRSTGA